MTFFLFTCPILPKCQYLMKCWTEFSHVQSEWSANGVVQIYVTGQSDSPRWPLAVVAKNSKNMKMTILKNLWMNSDQYYVTQVLAWYYNFFISWPSKMAASSITENSEKMWNRQYLMNYLIDFAKICVILMLSLSSKCDGTKQVRHIIPRNSCFIS